jgi:hypothetical protein
MESSHEKIIVLHYTKISVIFIFFVHVHTFYQKTKKLNSFFHHVKALVLLKA